MSAGVFFSLLHVVSIGFALLSLRRLYLYIRRYRFDESKYTLLFGVVHLHWITMAYPIVVLFWVAVSFLIIFHL